MSTAVLIVNYRGYEDLERCLSSLEPHIRRDDQVIVFDNESDETRLACVARSFPFIEAIPSAANLGFAAGVNAAAQRARAPFLLLLNPDTIVEGPVVAALEEHLRSHPETAVAGPRVLNGDGSIQPSARSFPGFSTLLGGRSAWLTRRHPNNPWSRHNLRGLDARRPLDVDWISGSCLMTRRDVFARLGGLDESFFLYWEDADYCWRAAGLGLRRTYVPTVPVRHFGGGSARYNLPRAIREFHSSAHRLYVKRSGAIGRLGAPVVRAGLHVRAELRIRRALAASTPASSPVLSPRTSPSRPEFDAALSS